MEVDPPKITEEQLPPEAKPDHPQQVEKPASETLVENIFADEMDIDDAALDAAA